MIHTEALELVLSADMSLSGVGNTTLSSLLYILCFCNVTTGWQHFLAVGFTRCHHRRVLIIKYESVSEGQCVFLNDDFFVLPVLKMMMICCAHLHED